MRPIPWRPIASGAAISFGSIHAVLLLVTFYSVVVHWPGFNDLLFPMTCEQGASVPGETIFTMQRRFNSRLLFDVVLNGGGLIACAGLMVSLQVLSALPGAGCWRFAQTVCSKRSCQRVFEPIISDMQREYIEALAEGAKWRSRFVLLRGYSQFAGALMSRPVVGLIELFEAVRKLRGGS